MISSINEEKCIGAEKERSRVINKIHTGDRILLLTKRNNLIEFFGYTQVDVVYQDTNDLYGYYFSRKKLKLKGIKYFSKSIPTKDVVEELDFIVNKNKSSSYFRSDYREISKEDFTQIYKRANLVKTVPSYLEEISMSFKEFMLSTINIVYDFVKSYEKRKQIEIKAFLTLLKKCLDRFEINKVFKVINGVVEEAVK